MKKDQQLASKHSLRLTSTANIVVPLFWVWGAAGFVWMLFRYTMMMTEKGVGVGTSAFLTAEGVIWIGGMLFFGLGSMVGSSLQTDGPAPVYVAPTPPLARGFDGEYEGIAFRKLKDGEVEAEFDKKLYSFGSWKEFVDAARK